MSSTSDTATDTTPPEAAGVDPRSSSDPDRWYRALAGAVGAAAALATGELFDGMATDVPSLVVAVGEVIVDYAPGDVAATSIETLGANQKAITIGGIVVVSLLVGGLLGWFSRTSRRPVIIGFALFGVVGGWAAARNPQSSVGWSWLAAILAALVGIGVTLWLLRVLAAGSASRPATGDDGDRVEDPRRPPRSRRQFLAWTGAGAVGTVAVARLGERLENANSVESARSAATLPGSGVPSEADRALASLDTLDDVPGVSSYITPNDDFYLIDTAFVKPQVDPDSWRLRIDGMVDEPYELSFADLQAMDLIDVPITMSCVSNEVGGDLVGNAIWTGVPLLDVLERAGIQDGAEQVFGRSVDDWTAGFPLELLRDGRSAVLAIGMNGELLPVAHGFPARLVVSGLYGYVSAVKWVEQITLTTWEGNDGYWIPRGWSKEGPMKTSSRIDVPNNNDTVAAGPVAIAGIAWAPTRGIDAVEVRVLGETDDGEALDATWQPARLAEGLGDETWRQWVYEFDGRPGQYAAQVRATDGTGAVQSDNIVDPRPDGAEGHHTISFTVRA